MFTFLFQGLSQQNPLGLVDLTLGGLRIKSVDPDEDTTIAKGWAIDIRPVVYKNIWKGLHFGAGPYYRAQGADLGKYSAYGASFHSRYYIGNPNIRRDGRLSPTIRKRLSFYADIGYSLNFSETFPENNSSGWSGKGFTAQLGVDVYLTKYFGIAFKYGVDQNGPAFGKGYSGSYLSSLTFPLLRDWPTTRNETDRQKFAARAVREIEALNEPWLLYTRIGIGYAPDRGNTEPRLYHHLLNYSLEAGITFPKNLSAGIVVRRPMSYGSRDNPNAPNASYWEYGLAGNYELPLGHKRFGIYTGLLLLRSNFCSCGPEEGYKQTNLYRLGGTGGVRWKPKSNTFVDLGFRADFILNSIKGDWGNNYPELSVTLPVLAIR